MTKRVAVVGLGRMGSRIATTLVENGAEVIAVDRETRLVHRLKDVVAFAVALDCTDEDALRLHEIDKVDIAIVAIGEDFETNVLTVALLKKLGVEHVIGRAGSAIQADILRHVGADRVTFPEDEIGERLADTLIATGIKEFINLGEDLSLVFIHAPAEIVGTAIKDLDLRDRYGISIVALQKEVARVSVFGKPSVQSRSNRNPQPDDVIEADSTLLIAGHPRDITKFAKEFGSGNNRT